MVLRLRQHNIGYTADGFTGLMTQPTVSKHWRRVVSHPDRPHSNHAHLTVLQYYNKHAEIIQENNLTHTKTGGQTCVGWLIIKWRDEIFVDAVHCWLNWLLNTAAGSTNIILHRTCITISIHSLIYHAGSISLWTNRKSWVESSSLTVRDDLVSQSLKRHKNPNLLNQSHD